MGCASSAPFMGEGGPLGEVKTVTNDMVESGEQALNDLGKAATETAHHAVEQVKEAAGAAASGLQSAAENAGAVAGDAAKGLASRAQDAVHSLAPQKPASEAGADLAIMDILDTPPRSPEIAGPAEMFKPTPVPSFDKPPTPGAAPLPDIPEASAEGAEGTQATQATQGTQGTQATDDTAASVDELLRDTAAAAEDASAREGDGTDKPSDPECDLRPTRWEALADAIVELPPRMSIDLGTGQLYAVVDEGPRRPHPRPALARQGSGDAPAPATLAAPGARS